MQVAGKREPEQEAEAQQWIETVVGERFPPGESYQTPLISYCRKFYNSFINFQIIWNRLELKGFKRFESCENIFRN